MGLNKFEKQSHRIVGYFICSALGAIFGTALLLLFGPDILFSKLVPEVNVSSTPVLSSAVQSASTDPNSSTPQAITDVSYAVNLVLPSVVGVQIPIDKKTTKAGIEINHTYTGVIIDRDGYILTKAQQLGLNARINITLYDGSNQSGKVIWSDTELGISLIKIKGTNYSHAELGDTEKATIGDTVIAIGNPLGLKFQHSVSSGIISELNRTVKLGEDTYLDDLIQTDAVINEDNDGGPLINTKGEVIGINTVINVPTAGFSYVIPIDTIKPIMNSFKKTGTFLTPVLGIRGIDQGMSTFYEYRFAKGIYVYDSVKDSPGYISGIREGDCIISINGFPTNTLLQLKKTLYSIGINGTALVNVKHKNENTNSDIRVVLTPFYQ